MRRLLHNMLAGIWVTGLVNLAAFLPLLHLCSHTLMYEPSKRYNDSKKQA